MSRFSPAALRELSDKLIVLVAVTAAAGVLAGVLVVPTAFALTDLVEWLNNDLLNVPPLPDAEPPPENSYIYAADGSLLAEINFEEQRVPVTLEQIPDVLENAVIATEDADFWQHNGVNYAAIVRAAVSNARAGEIVQGGSTITQQYVKIAYIEAKTGELASQTVDRKIQEALWALDLERRISKREILERYLNRSYFGQGVYGVGTAAVRYFNKPVGDLTLSEAATLAGIIRSPENNNPIDNFPNAVSRRNVVLSQMADEGYVTRDQADTARESELVLDPREPKAPDHPFWTEWITRLLVNKATGDALGSQIDALSAMGETPQERRATVFQAGLRIHTTLNPEFQRIAEQELRNALLPEDPTPVDVAQAPLGSIVSVEPGTGAIRTLAVGPREFGDCPEPIGIDDAGRLLCDKTKFNPAVPADAGSDRVGRQPGSSFKPYVTTAALEAGIPPTWTVNANGPAIIDNCDAGGPWEVRNAGGDGMRDMYSGIKGSSNVFHAKLIKEVGPSKVVDIAQRLGVTRSPLPAECSLALGAVEIFPLEHATGFATLANRGQYCAPYAIERIEDAAGNIVYEYSPRCQPAIDTAVADRVVDILKGPVEQGGTAPVANLGRWPTRGKTGTTNDYIDAWFMGFVKQLATAAWVGYENGVTRFETLEQAQAVCRTQIEEPDGQAPRCVERRYMTNVTIGGRSYARVFGGTIPAPMWKAYMQQVVERFDPQEFPPPGPLPSAVVPDFLLARTITDAQRMAAAAGVNLLVTEEEHWRPAGTLVRQTPAPGTPVQAGQAVTLYVSDGSGQPPAVPNVVGLTREEAEARLTELGFVVRITEEEARRPRDWGRVIDQDPKAGTEIPDGERRLVRLTVGVSPVDEPTDEPSEDDDAGPGKPKKPGDDEDPDGLESPA